MKWAMVQKGIDGYWAVIDKHTHYKITDQDVKKHNLQSGDAIQIEPSCNPGFARILQRASKEIMKIKLSKKQWEEMGKTAGWKKTAGMSSVSEVTTMIKILKDLQHALLFEDTTDVESIKNIFKDAERTFESLKQSIKSEGLDVSEKYDTPRSLKFRDIRDIKQDIPK